MNSGIIDDAVATIDGETTGYDNSYVDFYKTI